MKIDNVNIFKYQTHFGEIMKKKKLMAVASSGGHWVQLNRMSPAFDDFDVSWVNTSIEKKSNSCSGSLYSVRDANMWDKFGLLVMAFQIAWLVFTIRPHVIVTTGAAPGYFAIVFGRILGVERRVWIDSIANVSELSLAGRKIKYWTTHWLTQWPDLAKDDGPHYVGAVL